MRHVAPSSAPSPISQSCRDRHAFSEKVRRAVDRPVPGLAPGLSLSVVSRCVSQPAARNRTRSVRKTLSHTMYQFNDVGKSTPHKPVNLLF